MWDFPVCFPLNQSIDLWVGETLPVPSVLPPFSHRSRQNAVSVKFTSFSPAACDFQHDTRSIADPGNYEVNMGKYIYIYIYMCWGALGQLFFTGLKTCFSTLQGSIFHISKPNFPHFHRRFSKFKSTFFHIIRVNFPHFKVSCSTLPTLIFPHLKTHICPHFQGRFSTFESVFFHTLGGQFSTFQAFIFHTSNSNLSR